MTDLPSDPGDDAPSGPDDDASSDLGDDASSNLSDDAPTFEAPWEARAFALAVALTDEREADVSSWDEFQSRLVEEVDADREEDNHEEDDHEEGDPETVYYRQWLTALERLLVERNVLEPGELLARIDAFEAGDRDAHEFVEGDPHAHADRLPEGHAEGSDHDHGGHHDHANHHDHEGHHERGNHQDREDEVSNGRDDEHRQ